MSSIIEDYLNIITTAVNAIPSEESLQEYISWKTSIRPKLVGEIKGKSVRESKEILLRWYFESVEYKETKDIVDLLDSEVIVNAKVHSTELITIDELVKSGRITNLEAMMRHIDHSQFNREREQDSRYLIEIFFKSRLPILNDIHSMSGVDESIKTILAWYGIKKED